MNLTRFFVDLFHHSKESVKNYRPNLLQIVSIGISIALSIWLYLAHDIVARYANYGYTGIFLISAIGNATIIVPVASLLAVFALGPSLNPYGAGVAAGVGSTVGEMLAYLVGYSFQQGWQGSFFGYSWGNRDKLDNTTSSAWYPHLHRWVEKWGLWVILFLAFVPNPIFDVGGIVAGYTGIRWWKFFLITAFGKSLRFIFLLLFANVWL